MQLSKRLQMVAGLVKEEGTLADIGTDHAYIPIYLISKHKIKKAIAMDIGKGPLAIAADNIKMHGLEDLIETRLSDGLKELLPYEADSIVIAGMGGDLMSDILKKGRDRLTEVKELIVQPQSKSHLLRKQLSKEGYYITHEQMIIEDEKFYVAFRAIKGEEEYKPIEYLYGKILLKEKNPILKKYLEKEQDNYQLLYDTLQKKDSQSAKERVFQIKEELRNLKEGLDYYEL